MNNARPGRRAASAAARKLLAVCSLSGALLLLAQLSAQPAESRGALLYQTHCIACHDTRVHWRDRRLAKDWGSLSAQVRRWQDNTGLQWTDEEIEEVVRYLNSTIYRFPEQSPKQLG